MRRILGFVLACSLLLCACGQKEGATWQEQYDLGVRYLDEGNYEEAIMAFTAAIEIDPKRPEAYIGRGDAYLASGDSPDSLAAAEEDYLTALELDDQLEEVYEKLSELYAAMGDSQKSLEILEEGADALDSGSLRRRAERQRAQAYSDQELIDLANDAVITVYSLEYTFPAGAWFEQDWGTHVEDEAGRWWFPVIDPEVQSLADVEAYWNRYFSSRYPLPENIGYREIDGHLYCGNGGIGGDVTLLDYVLTGVQSRSGTSAVLTGYALRQRWEGVNTVEYKNHFRYLMDFEDGVWKCSGFEEGDRIYDAVPDDREQFPAMFDNTFWLWKLSPGNGGSYYALFHGDGTFSYIRPTDFASGIGTYEYDGTRLYLNGTEYGAEGQSFASTAGYDVMGGVDWHYTLTPDSGRQYLELEARLYSRN